MCEVANGQAGNREIQGSWVRLVLGEYVVLYLLIPEEYIEMEKVGLGRARWMKPEESQDGQNLRLEWQRSMESLRARD